MSQSGWLHVNPQTRFWIGDNDNDDGTGLNLSYEVGALLITEGFWAYCKENVVTDFPVQFNGPWEGGSIYPPELDAFINAVRHLSSQYDSTQVAVRREWGWGDDLLINPYVEATHKEILDVLGKIEALAVQARNRQTSLQFET